MKWGKLLGAANKARLFRYLTALWLLIRDRRTPVAPKVIAGLVVAYALSPIDLIPDVVPVLGLLDDVILIPLGIALAVRLTPPALWQEMLQQAEQFQGRLPKMVGGLLIVLVIWAALLGVFAWWLLNTLASA